jgi:ankyrin repeat protein
MLTATHSVLLGADADAQSCVAAALPPMALGRLRCTCHGASGAAPVGVDWARLCQPTQLIAAGELCALQYLHLHDKDKPDPWYTLCTAAYHGQVAVVDWALGLNRMSPDHLLHVAASASDPEVFQLLIAAGLEHSPNALLYAVKRDNLALLTAVLDAGVHPDSKPPDRVPFQHSSALLGAARNGKLECMRLLIEHKADVHARAAWGTTALMETTRAGHTECVRLLLEHKADVHAQAQILRLGRTALNFGKGSYGGDQDACTRLLLEAGADVNAADEYGRTALMHAALYGNRSLSPLLEAGADVHAADANGFTPMLSACRSGYIENVLLLHGLGADPHAVSADGTTALMLACMRSNGDIVRWLIDKKVDLDAQHGDEGLTALIFSAGDQQRMLIEAGADLDVTDTHGWTALMHECNNGNTVGARELIAAGADTWVSSEVDADAARELIEDGADTWESSKGKCALDLASEGQHWKCVIAVAQARDSPN